MKKNVIKVLVILMLVVFNFILRSETNEVVDNIFKPQSLTVLDGKFYIAEGSSFKVYNLENFRFIHQFGKKGEGPGELKFVPFIPNTLTEVKDCFIAESIDKIIKYSKTDLKLLYEKKKGAMGWNLQPVGKNYIITRFSPNDGDKVDIKLILLDENFKTIKVLHKQPTVDRDEEIIMLRDSIGFSVMGGKIYVEKSIEGFIIDVFDDSGELINRIEKDQIKKFPVTEKYKTIIRNQLKTDGLIKGLVQRMGGWQNFVKKMTFTYPQMFPVIREIKTKSNKIYVMTYTEDYNLSKLFILDPEGKLIKVKKVPFTPSEFFAANSMGKQIQLWDIYKGHYYYLDHNQKNDQWSLKTIQL